MQCGQVGLEERKGLANFSEFRGSIDCARGWCIIPSNIEIGQKGIPKMSK